MSLLKHKKLPRFYLITPDFDGNLEEYLHCLEQSLINGVRLVQLRSKNLPIVAFKKLAQIVIPLIHRYEGKVILNTHYSLLKEVNADGIHYPARILEQQEKQLISDKYLFSGACHNETQLKKAAALETDFVMLCPVFETPGSPAGIPIGWDKFKKLAAEVNLVIYAAGGINFNDLKIAQNHGAYGIGARRSLWNLSEPLLNY